MENYKEMYYHLFNQITTAIELLQASQKECEELFIKSEDKEKNDGSNPSKAHPKPKTKP